MGGQKLFNVIVGNILALCLMIQDKLLKYFDQNFLDFSSKHFASTIFLSNLFKFFIVFQEKAKVLVGNIDSEVCSIFFLFFFSGSSSTERVLFDFILNLLGTISHKDS